MTRTNTEHDIDKIIGERLHAARLDRRLTQATLAEYLGVTYQQLQKYERGTNRLSAARLYRVAAYFCEPLHNFFEKRIEPGPADPLIVHLLHRWPRLDERTRQSIGELAGIPHP